jgi:hypothetical protein
MFSAINTSTSTSTHRTSLFIGIKNPTEIRRYEEQTKNLFTIEHYKRLNQEKIRNNHRNYRINHRENRRHRY